MRFWRIPLVLISVGLLALPAPAGILFGKKTKPNPVERVPELIGIVKTDKDESKRASAAEELRQYDTKAYPDIVPVLIDVLLSDAKPGVRSEAAESLGNIRPISQEAGWALEQARDKDTSVRVRTKARYELLGYYWAGYHSDPKLKDAPAANPKEQAGDKSKPGASVPARTVTGSPGTTDKVMVIPAAAPKVTVPPTVRPGTGETPPPPLADPMLRPAPAPALGPQPLPTGPTLPLAPAKVESPALPPLPTPVIPPTAAKVPAPPPLPPIPLPPADGGPRLNGPGE